MVMENLLGLMETLMKENLKKILLKEWEYINGMMVESTQVNGAKTRCMGKVNLVGQMVKNTSEIMKTIKNKAMESFIGLKVRYIKANGKKGSKMERDC